MQSVLSIDISGDAAQVAVFSVDGRKISLIERHTKSLGDLFSKDRLAFPATATSEPPTTAAEEAVVGGVFIELLEQVQAPWQRGVLVIPPYDLLALNLDLPFGDPKNVGKIIDLEVQDLVPFGLEDFLLQHSTIVKNGGGKFDTHVSIIPKHYVAAILGMCSGSQFEPAIVSTPSSVLGAVYQLAQDYVAPNSAILFSRDSTHHLVCAIDGLVRTERAIERRVSKPDGSIDEGGFRLLLGELKIAIAAVERRYQKNIESIYLIGATLDPAEVQRALGRQAEAIRSEELIPEVDDQLCLSGLCAVYAYDHPGQALLTNFRTREFAYSPQMRELVGAVRSLLPYFATVFAVGILSLALLFFLRENRISKISDAMIEAIESAFPNASASRGQELEAIEEERKNLRRKLDELGSPSSTSPLEVLTEVAERVSRSKGVEIQRIRIQGERISLDVSVADYSATDQLMRKLRQSRAFCNIQEKTSGGAGSPRITVEMSLCKG